MFGWDLHFVEMVFLFSQSHSTWCRTDVRGFRMGAQSPVRFACRITPTWTYRYRQDLHCSLHSYFASTPPPCPEVHEDVQKSWTASFTARSCSFSSSILIALDGAAIKGYVDIQQVDCAIAVHLCLQNTDTWRNFLCLPSKAGKMTAALSMLPQRNVHG